MSIDKKRIFLIFGFIITTIVLGFFVYQVFFKKAKPFVQTPTDTDPLTDQAEPGSFPQSGTGSPGSTSGGTTQLPSASTIPGQGVLGGTPTPKVSTVVEDSILGASTDPRGNLQYYNQNTGQFFRVKPNGSQELLSDEVFYNVQNANFSPTKNEVIIEYPDGNNLYYNFDSKKQVTLPKHWENFSFSDQGDKIAAKSVGFSPENRWLVTSNPDGSSVRLVENLGENQNKVTVNFSPNNQIIATSRTGEQLGSDREEILFVGQNGENFKSAIVEGRGFSGAWSPKGDKILYSVYSARSDFKPELWIVNANGSDIGTNRKLLGTNTWADKCTFAGDRFVYCGVPENLQVGAGFAPQVADGLRHNIQRIDTETGLATSIELDRYRVIDKIFTDSVSGDVFFTDKNTSGVFKLDI